MATDRGQSKMISSVWSKRCASIGGFSYFILSLPEQYPDSNVMLFDPRLSVTSQKKPHDK